jgi:hypothetical protein
MKDRSEILGTEVLFHNMLEASNHHLKTINISSQSLFYTADIGVALRKSDLFKNTNAQSGAAWGKESRNQIR